MIFSSPLQHSISQLQRIYEAIDVSNKNPLSLSQALHIATELVAHGSPLAKNFITQLQNKFPSDLVRDYCNKLLLQTDFINSIPNLHHVLSNKNLIESLYKLNGFFYHKGLKYPNKMLVVFTTMFNNFYLSNPVLYALISHFGVSLLLLKDATRFNYLNGVDGFGKNLRAVAEQIVCLAGAEKIEEIYITGFSSGGYASLLCSSFVSCNGYLGFSITSDLSKNSLLKPGKYFTKDVSSKISDEWLMDLGSYLNDNVIRRIYYGINSPQDKSHALNLCNVPNLSTTCITDCGHLSIASLMEKNMLSNIFEQTLFNVN